MAASAAFDEMMTPDDVVEVVTDDYRLLRFPDRMLSPTLPAAQVVRSASARPIEELIDEVTTQVRVWGLDEVHWWIDAATRPDDTEAAIVARGGVPGLVSELLALELDDQVPEKAVGGGDGPEVVVELVRDERAFRAVADIERRGWGRPHAPDEAALARAYEVAMGDLEAWSEFRVVVFVDGEPASTGACTPAAGVARLWGAVTLPPYRHRGCYRAVLAARIRLARERGATLALTRGRPATSAPILRRAGFTPYDEERSYRLSVV